MASAARFISLLTSPLPISLIRHRPFLRPISFLRLSPSLSLPRQKLHSLPSHTPAPLSHPWPEWSKFVDSISSFRNVFEGRDGGGDGEDGFVAYEEVSEEFVRVSNACLAFARERSDLLSLLPRRDIEVVVENGTPFLFKSALDTARRMRAFLGMAGDNNVLETEKAQTVDLMKYLLSYASNTVVSSDRGGLYNGELLESSVRNLLSEIYRLSGGATESDPSMTYNFADRYGQTSRNLGPNIKMKRGDWICSKCNFMNFARNMKCLECEETRPKRQLTGGEWECPQCDFFNYGRNQVCLRCDCKRPSEASFVTNSSLNLVHGNTAYAKKPDLEGRLAANEEKAQRWFSKVSQMDSASDLGSTAADEDFPEIMPLRKGQNKFVVSTRKTPLERRLTNSEYQMNSSNSLGSNEFQNKATRSKGSSSSYVPFVPFPSDMFAKKPVNSEMEEAEITDSFPNKSSEKSFPVSGSTESKNSMESMPPKQGEDLDKAKEQDKKPETWFSKMAELQGVKDLSTISKDEDFPEIMPMRKGENRFVVSKKKDRSLTSPMYKRKMAVEQSGNTNFVPFVPFPPDYFSKKDKEPSMADTTPKDKTENSSSSIVPNSMENKIDRTRSYPDARMGNRETAIENSSTAWKGENFEKSPSPTTESQRTHIVNSNTGWKGKSLEGSAVVEPDPLDMSEEAKAQRWFRRAAQIKDISELSQIPDEDFPSIMPMRKGVNRFVVSKRKTPLERRLTSPQYKRNLPIVTSDTLKKENDNS